TTLNHRCARWLVDRPSAASNRSVAGRTVAGCPHSGQAIHLPLACSIRTLPDGTGTVGRGGGAVSPAVFGTVCVPLGTGFAPGLVIAGCPRETSTTGNGTGLDMVRHSSLSGIRPTRPARPDPTAHVLGPAASPGRRWFKVASAAYAYSSPAAAAVARWPPPRL